MTTVNQYAPTNGRWTDDHGRLTTAAQIWLRDLWLRTGGLSALTPAELEALIAQAVASLAAHEAAPDPHPGYLTPAEGDAAYQPLDSDLTAIAALTTTAFGRGLLALVGSVDMTATAFAGLPAGALTPTPQEVVVKQSGAWVRLAWADFLSIINGMASLDFSKASNSQYIGAVHI